ncbi:sensor histidine kinase [Kineococcus sp. R86509]|uniref:sensor histidine kinase n=1 Tax=Kineococcus sp. R86509 TaxID=3093851 RepID=UPI0036D4322F
MVRDVTPSPPWRVLADGTRRAAATDGPSRRRLLLQVGAAVVVVIVAVVGASLLLARQIAEREAVSAAAQVSDLLAESVVQGALDDDLLSADPVAAAAARARVRDGVGDRVLSSAALVRVKLWTSDGRIVYSDEDRLVGRSYPLEAEELEALDSPRLEAEVTDLTRPENELERDQGKLLEVYRPVWTPSGQPLLFETYTRYSQVSNRTGQLWSSFAGLLASSLLLLVVLLVPVIWALLDRLRRSQDQREALLQDAVDASARERQRIAARLHDGVVQELVAASYSVAAAAQEAERDRATPMAHRLEQAAATVRGSIAGLRSLLVDIYPPSLSSAGLATAVGDLAGAARSHGLTLDLRLPGPGEESGLDTTGERLVFQVAQETVRNAVAHADARSLAVHLRYDERSVQLEVVDDGAGFDSTVAQEAAEHGHFGLRLLPDLARDGGAHLFLSTAPGSGTRWLLEVPRS